MTRTNEFIGETISKEDRLNTMRGYIQRAATEAGMFDLQSEFQQMLEQALGALPQPVSGVEEVKE